MKETRRSFYSLILQMRVLYHTQGASLGMFQKVLVSPLFCPGFSGEMLVFHSGSQQTSLQVSLYSRSLGIHLCPPHCFPLPPRKPKGPFATGPWASLAVCLSRHPYGNRSCSRSSAVNDLLFPSYDVCDANCLQQQTVEAYADFILTIWHLTGKNGRHILRIKDQQFNLGVTGVKVVIKIEGFLPKVALWGRAQLLTFTHFIWYKAV